MNEKSNSLSVISEKISLLNNFEETSNQKQKRKLKKEKFSSKNTNDNSERNGYKNMKIIKNILI